MGNVSVTNIIPYNALPTDHLIVDWGDPVCRIVLLIY